MASHKKGKNNFLFGLIACIALMFVTYLFATDQLQVDTEKAVKEVSFSYNIKLKDTPHVIIHAKSIEKKTDQSGKEIIRYKAVNGKFKTISAEKVATIQKIKKGKTYRINNPKDWITLNIDDL